MSWFKAIILFVFLAAASCVNSCLVEAQLTHIFESQSLIFILSAVIGLTNSAVYSYFIFDVWKRWS